MNGFIRRDEQRSDGGRLLRGMGAIVLTGIALGLLFNALGQQGRRPWGLPWIAEDRMALLEASAPVTANESVASDDSFWSNLDDPLAVPATATRTADLPEIPAAGRPVQIELGAVEQYVDAAGAIIIDARDAEEFAEGRIPGALNLPYDEVITDPVRLESLKTGGRPIIVYCGGGACESSLSLADELIYLGHDRVAVYVGGYPEWVETGHAVEQGAAVIPGESQ